MCINIRATHHIKITHITNIHNTQDKRLKLSLNGNRKVVGTLRGYDAFLNIVLENAENDGDNTNIGTIVIRGNSVIQFESVERITTTTTS